MDDKGGYVESEKTGVAVVVGEGREVKWNSVQPLRWCTLKLATARLPVLSFIFIKAPS